MLDAYRDLIDDLLSTPTEIRALVETPGGSGTSPEAKRLVAEFRNRDRAILERVQTMTREETPYLPALRLSPPGDDEDLSVLLDEMEVARGDLVSLAHQPLFERLDAGSDRRNRERDHAGR